MSWVIDDLMMDELERELIAGGREQALSNLLASRQRGAGSAVAELRDMESDLTDILQCSLKGDSEALANAINDAQTLLVGRGWQVCEDCGEVWWPPDYGRKAEDGCPVCEEGGDGDQEGW